MCIRDSTSTDNQVNTIITETVINEISLTESVTMEAVSYTHLDVYKRQEPDS